MKFQKQFPVFILCLGVVCVWILLGKTLGDGEEKETLITETEEMQAVQSETDDVQPVFHFKNIRVLLCGDSYESVFHSQIEIQGTKAFTLSYGETTEDYEAGTVLVIEPGDQRLLQGTLDFGWKEEEGQFVFPKLKRAQEAPAYYGSIHVENRPEGLLLVNELPLETYLKGVVPSEMPSTYPREALKAQAICARTYALMQMAGERGQEYGVDVDDSVSYQVYNNFAAQDTTNQAVEETAGVVLEKDGDLIPAYYYSTSCGIDFSIDISQETVFCSFMDDTTSGYESREPWYRWNNGYTLEELTRLSQVWGLNLGNVTSLSVEERETSGRVKTLRVEGSNDSAVIENEYQIRKFLATDYAPVTLQDGSTAPNLTMLPSAYFYLTPSYDEGGNLTGYQLTGGGYGHGNGMSQNGAKDMAAEGKKAEEILEYYFGAKPVKK